MKSIKPFFIFFSVLLVALLVIGFFLPSSATISRNIVINKNSQEIFAIINDISRFNEWSPWYEIDPQARYHFVGPSLGVGAKMIWQSQDQNVGSGSQEIIESVANQKVTTKIDFAQQSNVVAQILLTPESAQATKVRWAFNSDFGANIIARYFGLMVEWMLGPMYEQGLKKLKIIAEKE